MTPVTAVSNNSTIIPKSETLGIGSDGGANVDLKALSLAKAQYRKTHLRSIELFEAARQVEPRDLARRRGDPAAQAGAVICATGAGERRDRQ